ncbi:MAG: hypothetical protein WA672_17660, partial [Candidatus Angelobacter sp.]
VFVLSLFVHDLCPKSMFQKRPFVPAILQASLQILCSGVKPVCLAGTKGNLTPVPIGDSKCQSDLLQS